MPASSAACAGIAASSSAGTARPLDVAHPDATVGDLAERISGGATSSGGAGAAERDAAFPAQAAGDAGIVEVAAP
ncbi:MAG: hypothetical protein ACKOKE_06500, partial [Actinomycetota bacterium]